MSLGDSYAGDKVMTIKGLAETYVCPQGFDGRYRVHLKKVWGDVTAGKVTVDVYTKYGRKGEQHQRRQIDLGPDGAVVQFDLEGGRRTEPLAEQQLAQAVNRQQAVSRAVLAQQLSSLSDPGVAERAARRDPRIAARLRRALGGGGAVGFQPVIVQLPEGTNFFATGVVSADRRYVRITALPFFSTIGEVTTFTFAGVAQQDEDAEEDGMDGGGEAPAPAPAPAP